MRKTSELEIAASAADFLSQQRACTNIDSFVSRVILVSCNDDSSLNSLVHMQSITSTGGSTAHTSLALRRPRCRKHVLLGKGARVASFATAVLLRDVREMCAEVFSVNVHHTRRAEWVSGLAPVKSIQNKVTKRRRRKWRRRCTSLQFANVRSGRGALVDIHIGRRTECGGSVEPEGNSWLCRSLATCKKSCSASRNVCGQKGTLYSIVILPGSARFEHASVGTASCMHAFIHWLLLQ
jgi:hypothetical protein